MTQQELEKAYRSETVNAIRHLLSDFYRGESFGMWLALPHPMLDGRSVLELINAGKDKEAIRLAAQLHDGVYV